MWMGFPEKVKKYFPWRRETPKGRPKHQVRLTPPQLCTREAATPQSTGEDTAAKHVTTNTYAQFIIVRRLAIVVSAGRILVLRKGRIIESGSRRELMAQNGYCVSLCYRQTRGLLAA